MVQMGPDCSKSRGDKMINSIFGGIEIRTLESPATYDTIVHVINRTLKERWLSLPLHPFKKTKIEFEHKPKPIILKINDVLYCHPKVFEKIKMSRDTQTKEVVK